MKLSIPLITCFITTTFAASGGRVDADDPSMIRFLQESLVNFNTPTPIDELTPEEDIYLNTCIKDAFNEVNDPAIFFIDKVIEDPEIPYALSRKASKSSRPKQQTPSRLGKFYPRLNYEYFKWTVYDGGLCRLCNPDCDADYAPVKGRTLCGTPEEARLLSDHDYFRLNEANRHIEWELGICDCLIRGGMESFKEATACKVNFSPSEMATGVRELPIPPSVIEDAELNKKKKEPKMALMTHESVIMYSTDSYRRLNSDEEAFLDTCVADTFNDIHDPSFASIKSVVLEPKGYYLTRDTDATYVTTDITTNTFFHIQWRNIEASYCRKCFTDDCYGKKSWLCQNEDEANFLSDWQHYHFAMAPSHEQWQDDICTCLAGSDKSGFKGIKDCRITFPPMQEKALGNAALEATIL